MRDGAGRRERLAASRLYVCTAIRPDLGEFADAVLGAGVDLIQLRDKQAEAGPLLEAAAVLRAAADRHGALFAVNDRADVALAAGATRVVVVRAITTAPDPATATRTLRERLTKDT